jgi:Rrf2 family protein
MKLSTKGRYAARLMLDLAIHYGQGRILLKDIAHRQDISDKYLGQLIMPLKNAGLVLSIRGSHGGYILSLEPASINLKQVIEAVEGSLSIVECVDKPAICPKSGYCVNRELWTKLSEDMSRTLESITLKDLADKQIGKMREKGLVYHI